MTRQIIPAGFWNSTPIGRSIDLCLCEHELLSPQLILEDKVLRLAASRLQNNSLYHSQIQLTGTLISDDESQRLTYVIDRSLAIDSLARDIDNPQLLTGEFLISIHCDNQNSTIRNNGIQNGIKEVDLYCHSSLPIELHRFSYLCGQISFRHPSSVDLSFDLLTIKNSFILTPINPDSVHIVPTALLKNLSSSAGNNIYTNRPHFGYCSVDRMSTDKILLILENDPQACTLPLVGIWISGVTDIQCAFVWAVCLRYCLNSSLKQRLRSGINPQQTFLLAYYSPTSYGQCIFYEVHSTSLLTIDYDLWTCSKQISIPNLSSYQYEINPSTQFPYDFQFKRVYDQPENYSRVAIHSENSFLPTEIPSDDQQQTMLSSPNTNGSLFGFPRVPPKQSSHQSPSWNTTVTTPITTPKRISQPSTNSPRLKQFSPLSPSTIVPTDNRWKEEFIERMKSYELQIQSLTTLVTQLLTTQQSPSSTPSKECTKRDVGVQSQPSSPCINGVPSSITKSNQQSSRSPNLEYQQPQTAVLHTIDRSLSPPMVQQEETIIDYSSLHRSSLIPTDVNSVDILKPIFQFIDKQQQQGSASALMTTYNSNDTTLLNINDEDTDNMFPVGNVIQQQQQQQHVTSTTMTGISFISNGVQMQFINQQSSSTTTVYPQSQPTPPPPPSTELLPASPPQSENSLSIEVHSLEMKYLEDDQLAVAIECDRQAQTPPVADKSLSFGTQEYLQRYGLFTDSNPS